MASNIVKYVLQISDKGATKSLKDIGRASDKTSKGLKKMDRQSKSSARNMKALAKSGNAIAIGIAAAGVALIAATGAIFKLGQKSADLVNALNDMEARSGVAAESIQALQFAFVASGQEASTVQGIIDKMPRIMSDLANQTGTATKAAEKLGVKAFDPLTGKMKDNNELMIELITSLQGVESQTERATIGVELFGRQAGNMLQAFGQTEGLQLFMEYTDRWGVDVGPQATKQAAQFQQAMAMLDVVTGTLAQTFASVFGEDGLINLVKWAGRFIVELGATIEAVVKFIGDLFAKMAQFGTELSLQWDQDFARATIKIAEYLSLIPGMEIDVTDAVASLEAAEKAAAEFTDAELLWPSLDDVLDMGGKASAQWERDFDKVLKQLQKEGKATGSVIGTAIGEGVTEGAGKAKDAWKEFFDVLDSYETDLTDVFDQIADGINDALQAIQDNFDRIISNIDKAVGVLSGIGSGDIGGLLNMGATAVAGPVGGAIAEGVSAVSSIGTRIEEEGDEFLKLDIENFVRGFTIGLAALPGILIEVLPPLLFEAAARIIEALMLLPFTIAKAIKTALQSGKEKRQKKREEEGAGANLKQAGEDFLEWWVGLGSKASGGRFIPSAQSGMRFTGNRRGLAMLHENEFVVPQSGQMPQSVERQFGASGGITINIHADVVERNAVDALVRKIERRFNLFGTSTSPLFNQG